MRLLRFSIFAVFCFLPFGLNAEVLSLDSKVTEKKTQIGLAYEKSSFSTADGSIHGAGGRLTFLHSFTESWSAEMFFSTAINQQGSVQNSFTGFGGYALYTLLGKPYHSKKELIINGKTSAIENSPSQHALFIGPGINQFFLNGNQGVYSSSGLSVTAMYEFDLLSICWKVSARKSILRSGDVSVDGLSYDLGFVIPL